jgi:hypothetical protein
MPADEGSSSPGSGQSAFERAAARFRLTQADLIGLVDDTDAEEDDLEPLEDDDPEHALGLRIARVDVEQALATAYLTFEDGHYLVYAARIDEGETVLLDRFLEPVPSYEEYWICDDLDGKVGPPPAEQEPLPGSGRHPTAWRGAEGRTLADLGWYEEGMQAFLRFEEGGYLTLAARSDGGTAYLIGYFSGDGPHPGEEYLHFELPEQEPD